MLRFQTLDPATGGIVNAHGPRTVVEIKLPATPKKVELDPDHRVLSESTSTKSK
ncbi:MAG TPA: hypothetical protein VER32_00235 [Pyrinomonadaceae bacterium]|nr:hypothetical protein [Pyrinomonadaceae bacterium]